MKATDDIEQMIKKLKALPLTQRTEVEDFVDFLRERSTRQRSSTSQKGYLEFPVDDLGAWPEGLSLHREDMYGDDGR
jgi:hypothetical protein